MLPIACPYTLPRRRLEWTSNLAGVLEQDQIPAPVESYRVRSGHFKKGDYAITLGCYGALKEVGLLSDSPAALVLDRHPQLPLLVSASGLSSDRPLASTLGCLGSGMSIGDVGENFSGGVGEGSFVAA